MNKIYNLQKLMLLLSVLLISTAGFCQLPFQESFDGTTFAPTGWTHLQVNGTGLWARSTSGSFPTCTPKSGAGMLFYNDFSYASNTSAAIITPAIDLSAASAAKVEFWMYRDAGYSTTADNVEVFINTAANMTGALSLGVINRSKSLAPIETSADGWYKYAFNVPGTYNTATNYFLFKATNKYGNNIFVDEIRIYVPAVPNAAPATFSATSVTNSSMTINWVDNSTDEIGFRIYKSSDNVTFAQVGTDITSTTAATSGTAYNQVVSGLTYGTTYYYKVVAYSDGETAPLIGSQTTNPAVTPASPTTLAFSAITSSGMTLNWVDNSADELGFKVYISNDGTNFTKYGSDIASTTVSATGDAYNVAVTGLTIGTTYHYRVVAYNDFESAYLTGSQATNPPGNIVSTSVGGNWSDVNTWVGGVVPTATDNVIIADAATVILDAVGNCYTLTVGQGVSGVLSFKAFTLTVGSNVAIAVGGTLNIDGSGGTTGVLSVAGNLTNNGTLDLFTSTTVYGKLVFAGTGNATFTTAATSTTEFAGSLTSPYIMGLEVNKGTDYTNNSLEFIPENTFAVGGTPNATFVGLTNGMFKLSGTITQSSKLLFGTSTGSTTIAILPSAGFWLNNPNFTMEALGASTNVRGSLKISAGTYNVGLSAGNSLALDIANITSLTAGLTKFEMTGGTLNIAARLAVNSANYPATFIMSGGTINLCGVSNTSTSAYTFDMHTNANSSFTMSGGTIVIGKGTGATWLGGYDFRGLSNTSANANITGGTVQFGSASNVASCSYKIQGIAPNVVLFATNNPNLTLGGNTTILGDLTTNGTGTFSLSFGYTLSMKGNSVTNSGNITNNGTMTLNGSDGNILKFESSLGNQTFTNNGTITTSQLPQVVINNTFAGGTVTLPDNLIIKPSSVYNGLTLTEGALVANNLTLGNGGSNGFVLIRKNGSITNPVVYNFGTGTARFSYLNTVPISTSGEITPAFNNRIIMNADANLTLTQPVNTNELTLTKGAIITTSTNLLTLTNTDPTYVVWSTGYVNGPFAMTIPANQSTAITYSFPVGKGQMNLFELVNPTTNAGGSVVVKAEVFDANSGGTVGTGMSANTLRTNRYWEASIVSGAANFTNATVKLTETTPALTADEIIGQSATLTGAYAKVSSAAPTGSTIISDAITTLDFFAIGKKTSSDATLSDLKVDGTTVTGFASATITYDVELPYGTTVVPTVTATANNTNAQTPVITPAAALPGSTTVAVTAEDGTTTKTYTINFTVAKNNVATLSDLKVDGTTITGFASGTETYNLILPFGTATVPTITATATDVNAVSVVITPTGSLPGATTVVVTAENGTTTTTYTVNIKAGNNVTTLSDLKIDGTTLSGFASGINSYNVMLPNVTTLVPQITAVTLTDANASQVTTQAVNLTGTAIERTATVVVTSEDGLVTETYSVTFKVGANVTTLTDLKVDGTTVTGFASGTDTYTVILPFGTTTVPQISLATLTDANASLVVTQAVNVTGTLGERTATVVVTAEDLVITQTYSVIFKVGANVTTLSALEIDNVALTGFVSGTSSYTIILPFGTSSVPQVTLATPSDVNASKVITQAVNVTGTAIERTATIVVTAEDMVATQTYYVTYEVGSNITTLSDLKVDGSTIANFASGTTSYTVVLPFGTTVVPQITLATLSDPSASLAITQAVNLTGNATDRTATVQVTAVDMVATQTYSVTFLVGNNVTTLSDLQVDNGTIIGFAPATNSYTIILPFGTTTVPQITLATTTDANASKVITQAVNVTGTLAERTAKVEVTAEDLVAKQSYYVTYLVGSDLATLADLKLDGTTINGFASTTYMYDVILPFGTTTVPQITLATTTDVNAAKIVTQAVNVTGTLVERTAIVQVTAEDGVANQTYYVTFKVGNNDTKLTDLLVDGATVGGFASTTYAYNVMLPYGTTTVPQITLAVLSDVNASKVITQATNVSGTLAERTAKVVVTAEDMIATQTYYITFKVGNNVTTLSDLKIDGSTVNGFVSATNSYNVILPFGTTVIPQITLASLTDPNASSVITQSSSVNGTAKVDVTAEDLVAKQTYSVTFKVGSDDADLSDLQVTATLAGAPVACTLDPVFSAGVTMYYVILPYGSTNAEITTATTHDVNASRVLVQATDINGSTIQRTAKVVVTSEGFVKKTYTIVYRIGNNNAYLNDLKVDGTTIKGFTFDKFSYLSKILPAGTTTIPMVSATTADMNAKKVINQAVNVNGTIAERTATVVVTAEDRKVTQTYNVEFKVGSDVKTLSDLKVNRTTITGFAAGMYAYTVILPSNTTSLPQIAATTTDANASLVISQAVSLTGEVFERTAKVVVTAEDGVATQSYYVTFRLASNVAMLADLRVDGKTVDMFSATKTLYEIMLPAGTTTVPQITLAPTTDANASKVITQAVNVNGTLAERTAKVVVTAEDMVATTTYEVTYYVASNVATLSDLKVGGTTVTGFASSTFAYNVTLPVGTTAVPQITATVTDSKATFVAMQAMNVTGSLSERTAHVMVTAEDGTMKSYYVTFTVEMNNVATLSDIKVNAVTVAGFVANTLTYTVELPYGTKLVPAVTATTTDMKATKLITPATSLPGTTTIVVTSENSAVSTTYLVNFTLTKNNVTSLSDLKVDGTLVNGFDAGTLNYYVVLPTSATIVPMVTATAFDATAQVVITPATTLPGTTTVVVTAENGVATSTYSVTFTKEPLRMKVSFTISDAVGVLNGASVTFKGVTKYTNASGVVEFTGFVAENGIPYSVSKVGYYATTGTVDFVSADITKAITLEYIKVNQIITFKTIATKTYGDAQFNLEATGGASGNAITFVSSDPSVATIAGNTVTIVGAGTTIITASQTGNDYYVAAVDAKQGFTVRKKAQTITFPAFSSVKKVGDADLAPGATTTSVLAITYTSLRENIAKIVDGKIRFMAAGQTVIVAYQAGDKNTEPAYAYQELIVDWATGFNETSENVFKAYPNPSNGIFNLQGVENSTITISDLTGKIVLVRHISTPTTQIDLSNQAGGTYFIKVNKSGVNKTQMLIKK